MTAPRVARLDRRVVTIYGNHMSDTLKTTVYLGAADYRRLKSLSRSRGTKAAALVREAVAEYVTRHAPARAPKSIGGFSSGRPDLGQRAEELLAGFGRDR
jgi:hypothetical protein